MRKNIKKKLLFSILLTGLLFSSNSFAINLLQAYEQALKNDPTFKAAEAQYLANKELVPIARSAVLPNLSGTGSLQRQKISQSGGNTSGDTISQFLSQAGLPVTIPGLNPQSDYYNTESTYTISLSQTVFNWASFMALRGAKNSVKQAEATYYAAKQNLMIRLATAYFNVLQAYDTLKTVEAQRKALYKQLNQTQEQFKVGLIAITGVEQTKASYDTAVAQEIAAKNSLSDQIEALRAITGVYYYNYCGLNESLPLVKPIPSNIDKWVKAASQHNYTLLASLFGAKAAKDNISKQFGGHLPVLNANAGYNYEHDTDNGFDSAQTQSVAAAGLKLNLPIYSGGLINAQTRQASYQYSQAVANAEVVYRNTVQQTRQFYLGVLSGISQVKADKQAVISNESSLKATQASYLVGTNTIVDVLTQQSNLFNAQLLLTQDQYAYLINTLNLKLAAGTLSEKDIAIINSWLKQRIVISSSDLDSAAKGNVPLMEYQDFVAVTERPLVDPDQQGNVLVNGKGSYNSNYNTAKGTRSYDAVDFTQQYQDSNK